MSFESQLDSRGLFWLLLFSQLTLNKWPLSIGICGASIPLVIAFLLLRPLPESTPFVRGTELIHITRWVAFKPTEVPIVLGAPPFWSLLFFVSNRLLSVSDIPERMRSSPSTFHGMREHGGFKTGLDGGGSTLISEQALLSSSVSPHTLPIITLSETGFPSSISFREKPANSGRSWSRMTVRLQIHPHPSKFSVAFHFMHSLHLSWLTTLTTFVVLFDLSHGEWYIRCYLNWCVLFFQMKNLELLLGFQVPASRLPSSLFMEAFSSRLEQLPSTHSMVLYEDWITDISNPVTFFFGLVVFRQVYQCTLSWMGWQPYSSAVSCQTHFGIEL